MEISLGIPTYNTLNYLKLLLDSIKKHTSEEEFKHLQILLVSDGSTDGTNEFLLSLKEDPFWKQKSVRAMAFRENTGQCQAVNHLVEQADYEHIMLMNDDMAVPPQWFKRACNAYERIKEKLPLSPSHMQTEVMSTNEIVYKEKEPFVAFSLIEPGLITVAKEFFECNCGDAYNNFDMAKFNQKEQEFATKDTDHEGANYPFIMQKKDFMRLGGLDLRYRGGPLSDPDFYLRLALEGIPLVRTKEVLFYHFSGKATRFKGESKTPSAEFVNTEQVNAQKFFNKWGFPPYGRPDTGFLIMPPKNQIVKGIKY